MDAGNRIEEENENDNDPAFPAKKTGGRPKSMVWQYYDKASEPSETSKRCDVFCNFCRSKFVSRVEQMEAHLAQSCPAVPAEVRTLMRERIRVKAAEKARKDAGQAQSGNLRSPVPQVSFAPPLPQAKRVKTEEHSTSIIPLRLRFPQVRTRAKLPETIFVAGSGRPVCALVI